MAPQKSPRSKDDKTKKRKRDVSDADTKVKRHRAQDLESASQENGELSSIQDNDGEAGWRLSRPMGGRMLDIDPILVAGDEYATSGPPFDNLILTAL